MFYVKRFIHRDYVQIRISLEIHCLNKEIGRGFGDQSYLMVQLLILANLLVRFSTKSTLLPLSMYLQTEDENVTCTVNYVLVQYNVDMWFNCETTTTNRCKVNIYIYNNIYLPKCTSVP